MTIRPVHGFGLGALAAFVLVALPPVPVIVGMLVALLAGIAGAGLVRASHRERVADGAVRTNRPELGRREGRR